MTLAPVQFLVNNESQPKNFPDEEEVVALLFRVPCIKVTQLFQSFVLTEHYCVFMLFGLKLLMICAVTVLAALLVILLGPF